MQFRYRDSAAGFFSRIRFGLAGRRVAGGNGREVPICPGEIQNVRGKGCSQGKMKEE